MRWAAAVIVLAATACGGAPQRVVYAAPPLPRHDVKPMPTVVEPALGPLPKREPLAAVDHDVLRAELTAPKNGVLILKGGKPPEPEQSEPSPKSPKEVVEDARSKSLAHVEEYGARCGMDGDELVCKYARGVTYEVFVCAGQPVAIELAPGEVMTSEGFVFGPNYMMRPRASRGGGQEQSEGVQFWQPTEANQMGDGKGNTVVVYYVQAANDRTVKRSLVHFGTNIGPYKLDLQVLPTGDSACMSAVRWRHPDLDIQRALAEQRRHRARQDGGDDGADDDDDSEKREITCASGEYTVEVAEGQPEWRPTQVSHVCVGDHPRVVIQFPDSVVLEAWPVISSDGDVANCRTIPEDRTMVCDGLFSRAMLLRGSEQTGYERVYIRRLRKGSR